MSRLRVEECVGQLASTKPTQGANGELSLIARSFHTGENSTTIKNVCSALRSAFLGRDLLMSIPRTPPEKLRARQPQSQQLPASVLWWPAKSEPTQPLRLMTRASKRATLPLRTSSGEA